MERLSESAGGIWTSEKRRGSALPDGHILVDVVDISEHDLPRQHREGEGACGAIRHFISWAGFEITECVWSLKCYRKQTGKNTLLVRENKNSPAERCICKLGAEFSRSDSITD